MDVRHGVKTGCFNVLNPSEQQDQIYLYTPEGTFSDTFPVDDHGYHGDMMPSEVLDLLEKRLDSYWISTRRDEDKARMAKCREHMVEIDRAWLVGRIERARKKLETLEAELADFDSSR